MALWTYVRLVIIWVSRRDLVESIRSQSSARVYWCVPGRLMLDLIDYPNQSDEQRHKKGEEVGRHPQASLKTQVSAVALGTSSMSPRTVVVCSSANRDVTYARRGSLKLAQERKSGRLREAQLV